jgi:hypothetical protein
MSFIINPYSFAGGPQLWVPSDLDTNPVGWFQAAVMDTDTGALTDGVTAGKVTLNGSDVSAWANDGSVGGSAANGTASDQPAWLSTGFTGSLPCLDFDGASEYLSISPLLDSDPQQLYVLAVAIDENLAGSTIVFGHRSPPGVELYQHNLISGVRVQLRGSSSVLTNIQTSTFSGARVSESSMNRDASFHYAMYDGDLATRVTSNYNFTGETVSSSDQLIGAIIPVDVPAGFADMKLAELIVLDYQPGTDDQQLIQGYVHWKWGLESLLPAGHAYKSGAPTT